MINLFLLDVILYYIKLYIQVFFSLKLSLKMCSNLIDQVFLKENGCVIYFIFFIMYFIFNKNFKNIYKICLKGCDGCGYYQMFRYY